MIYIYSMLKPTKAFWQNSLLVIFSLIIACIAAELMLRVLFPEYTVEDPFLGYRMQPNFEYDENGFRNPKVLDSASIIAIGDSQTQGNNATSGEAWPYALRDITGQSIYSMAVGGYSAVQYAFLTEEAILMSPKLVIIALYTGNDLMEAEINTYSKPILAPLRNLDYKPVDSHVEEKATDYRAILGSGVEPHSLSYKILKVRKWIRANSKLYSMLGNATRSLREDVGLANDKNEKQEAIKEMAANNPDIAYVYDGNPKLETVMSPSYRLDTVDLTNPQTAEGWRITKERYTTMHKMLSDANIPHLTIIIPTKEKVYLDYMEKVNEEIPRSFTEYNNKESDLLWQIEQFCIEISMTCYSTLPDLSRALEDEIVIYGKSMDGHPKAAGYRVIAESIDKFLVENNFVSF